MFILKYKVDVYGIGLPEFQSWWTQAAPLMDQQTLYMFHLDKSNIKILKYTLTNTKQFTQV